MIHPSISSRPEPVHLRKAKLLSLLAYAMAHPHSHMWVAAIQLILARREGGDAC
jgi:hypothetical protein